MQNLRGASQNRFLLARVGCCAVTSAFNKDWDAPSLSSMNSAALSLKEVRILDLWVIDFTFGKVLGFICDSSRSKQLERFSSKLMVCHRGL